MAFPITNRSDLFELYFYEEDLPISTMRVAKSILNRVDAFLATQGRDISTATKLDVMKYMKKLEEKDGLSSVTALTHLVHLRRFYGWAVAGEYIDVDPTKGIKKRNTSRANVAHQPVMSEANYQAMLKLCPKNETGRRDAAMLSLLWHSGLRRAELCGLTIGQWKDHPQHACLIVGSADALNKNGQTRTVPLNAETAKLLRLYTFRFRKGADGRSPLFLSRSSADGRLRPNGVSHVLNRALGRAGIDEKTGVHSFRRAWAKAMVKAGMSTRAIMKMAGWQDEAMVAHYIQDHEGELALEEYYQKMGGQKAKGRAHLKAVV
jgi:site-specific recombinase XerD